MRGHTKQNISTLNYTMISLISNKVNILIVGGGEAAFIKCRSFSKEGCNVTVVSKEFCEVFKLVNELSNVELIKGDYNESYVDNNHIVIIATNNKQTNDIIKTHCDNKSKLYVHCEDHKKGLFVMPVQKSTSNMKFALHTKHSSPKTALFMAKIIEDKLLVYKDFISYTFNIRDKVMRMAGKKDIMDFVCSEDFYFFYSLGVHDDILEMFYGEELKEVIVYEN